MINLPAINSLRGIAAIMIMVHHITVYLLPQISVYTRRYTPFFNKNYLWVDFFFILSGFIACHVYKDSFVEKISLKNYSEFIISRFARLYPLHVLILTLFITMELVYLYFYHIKGISVKFNQLPIPFDSEYSEKALILGLMMLNALPAWGTWNGPSWAMSAIWIIAFILPFLIKFLDRFKIVVSVLISLVCYIILFILFKKTRSLDIMAAGGLLRCLSETIIGIGCYNIYCGIPAKRYLVSNYSLGLCIFITFSSMVLDVNHVVTVVFFSPLIIVGAFHGMGSLFSRPSLLLLGEMSFSIYLIHWLPFQLLEKVALIITGLRFHSMKSPALITFIIIAVSIMILYISFYVHKIIEINSRNYVKEKLMNIFVSSQ